MRATNWAMFVVWDEHRALVMLVMEVDKAEVRFGNFELGPVGKKVGLDGVGEPLRRI